MIFRVMTAYALMDGHQHVGGTHYLRHHGYKKPSSLPCSSCALLPLLNTLRKMYDVLTTVTVFPEI